MWCRLKMNFVLIFILKLNYFRFASYKAPYEWKCSLPKKNLLTAQSYIINLVFVICIGIHYFKLSKSLIKGGASSFTETHHLMVDIDLLLLLYHEFLFYVWTRDSKERCGGEGRSRLSLSRKNFNPLRIIFFIILNPPCPILIFNKIHKNKFIFSLSYII